MASTPKRVKLTGSHRAAPPGAVIGPAHSDEHIEVTLRVRARAEIPPKRRAATLRRHHKEREYLTREELGANHGASPEDMAKVAAFAREHGLAVSHASEARRSVWLAGTVAQMSAAFGVQLDEYQHPEGGTFRGRTGPLTIPAELDGIVVGVFGLDNRPQARPHFRVHKPLLSRDNQAAGESQFTPVQVGQLYNFPTNLDGTGECIGIIELGGGFNTSDLQSYFSNLGIPMPKVSSVSVDNGTNSPTGNSDGPDGEVMLDIEVAGAVAPAPRSSFTSPPIPRRGSSMRSRLPFMTL